MKKESIAAAVVAGFVCIVVTWGFMSYNGSGRGRPAVVLPTNSEIPMGDAMESRPRSTPRPPQKSTADKERERAGDFLLVLDVKLENIILSRRVLVGFDLMNTSETLFFDNVLVNIDLYDKTNTTVVYTERYRYNGGIGSDYRKEVSHELKLPMSVVKTNIGSARVSVERFEVN